MSCRLLLVTQHDVTEANFEFLPLDGFLCERLSWEKLKLDGTLPGCPELLLVGAARPAGQAVPFFEWLKTLRLHVPILAVLPGECEDAMVRCATEVADDIVFLPVRQAELRHRILRLLPSPHGIESISSELIREFVSSQLPGTDPVFVRVLDTLPKIAQSNAPVLITGETGTGKELCARAIHSLGPRRARPFIVADCSVIPEYLFENELFGHVRGAFTDAQSDQKGLLVTAQGGTLLLDEIDTISLAAQAKLLRFLQERTYKPLGAERVCHSDLRVIAASNRDLEECVRERRFRPDLFFRLNVLRLHLPPLRERRSDIEPLALHFLRVFAAEAGRSECSFSPGALRRLSLHDWPGNVRELGNVVQRAIVFSEGKQILPGHIAVPSTDMPNARTLNFRQGRQKAIETYERTLVEETLRQHRGNVTHAALAVGKDRRVFGRLIKKYGIHRETISSHR
jgi:two-component system response regulator GlrR